MCAVFVLLSYYFQQTLGYSPLKTGIAFLPFPFGIVVSAGIASNLLPQVWPRVLMLAGAQLGAGGPIYLAQLQVGYPYWAAAIRRNHPPTPDLPARAAIHSYDVGFCWGAGLFVLTGDRGRDHDPGPEAGPGGRSGPGGDNTRLGGDGPRG